MAMVKKRRMHRFAHRIIAAKRKGDIADAAADLGSGQLALGLPRGFNEGNRVLIVFFDARGHGQDRRIKNDVGRRHAGLLGKQPIGARGNFQLALGGVRLALLVKRHDDDARAVTPDFPGLLQENLLAFFQADGIDDAFALQAFQAGLDDGPARAINHNRHARDIGFGAECVEERGHGLFGVEHGLVHVHVDHLRAAFDLLSRNCQRRLLYSPRRIRLGKFRRASDVGAFADVHEIRIRPDYQRLEAAESRIGLDFWRHARRDAPQRLTDGANVCGG